MESKKDNVEFTRVDGSRRIHGRRASKRCDALIRGRHGRDATIEKLALSRVPQSPESRVDCDNLVTQRAQRWNYLSGARDGNIAFLASSAEEHRNSHVNQLTTLTAQQ